jgi:dipicolinate synthase subunit A
VDIEKAKERGIKTILALGLPGKVAPLTSARYIKEIAEKLI